MFRTFRKSILFSKSLKRSECEVCQKQKVTNPKGYYKTFLHEQKCYWNDDMYQDVLSFIRQREEQLLKEVEEWGKENCKSENFPDAEKMIVLDDLLSHLKEKK